MPTILDPSSFVTTSTCSANVTAFVKPIEVFLYGNISIRDIFSLSFSIFDCFLAAFFAANLSAFYWAFTSLSNWRCTAFSWASTSFLCLFFAACTFFTFFLAFLAFSVCYLASFSAEYVLVTWTLEEWNSWAPVSSLPTKLSLFPLFLPLFSCYHQRLLIYSLF